ncbi:hypothetical protein F0562_032833 [Nyssa sinensis]|uniref:Uncharacterized protein n=1 Tax=Nyssa sinensis TaxID=561372 RepID=A0A5J5AQC4_9ASTE|nr:hypothetical protein F0562_032833 [Nyssa sinensis]
MAAATTTKWTKRRSRRAAELCCTSDHNISSYFFVKQANLKKKEEDGEEELLLLGKEQHLDSLCCNAKNGASAEPKKVEDVKTEAIKKEGVEDAKGSLPCETVKKEEAVKVNVGSDGGGGGSVK